MCNQNSVTVQVLICVWRCFKYDPAYDRASWMLCSGCEVGEETSLGMSGERPGIFEGVEGEPGDPQLSGLGLQDCQCHAQRWLRKSQCCSLLAWNKWKSCWEWLAVPDDDPLLLGKIMRNAGTGGFDGKIIYKSGVLQQAMFHCPEGKAWMALCWMVLGWQWWNVDLTLPQLRKDIEGHASSGMVAHLTEEPLLEELLGSTKAMKEHAKAEKVSWCSWMSQPRYASFVLCIFAMKRTWSWRRILPIRWVTLPLSRTRKHETASFLTAPSSGSVALIRGTRLKFGHQPKWHWIADGCSFVAHTSCGLALQWTCANNSNKIHATRTERTEESRNI